MATGSGHDMVARLLADATQYLAEMKRIQEETRRTQMWVRALTALVRGPLVLAAGTVKAAWWAITTPIKFAADVLKTALGVMTGNLFAGGIQGIASRIWEWTKAGFSFNSVLEESRASFGVMFRDVAAGSALVEDLYKYAAYTVYEFEQVDKAAMALAGAGVKAQQIMPTLKMIGELGNTSTRPIQEVAELYAKIFSTGKITGEELRQFRRLGIPVFEELASVLGINKSEISKWAEEGKIGIGEFQRALVKLTEEGGIFHNMQKKLAETTPGLWATFKDALRMAAGEAASALVDIFDLKSLMKSGAQFGNWLRDIIKQWKPIVKEWWQDFRANAADTFWEITAKGIDFVVSFAEAMRAAWEPIKSIIADIKSAIDSTKEFIAWAADKTPWAQNREIADEGQQMADNIRRAAGLGGEGIIPFGTPPKVDTFGATMARLRGLANAARMRIGSGSILPPVPRDMGGDPFDAILNPQAMELEDLRTPEKKKKEKGTNTDMFARAVGGSEAWSDIAKAMQAYNAEHEKTMETEAKKTNEKLDKVKQQLETERIKLLEGLMQMNDAAMLGVPVGTL